MKLQLRILVFVMLLSFLSVSGYCSDERKVTCDDLTYVSGELHSVSNAFKASGTFKGGDDIDMTMSDFVDVLVLIADLENDEKVSKVINNLLDAYNKTDAEQFGEYLEALLPHIDQLVKRDCGS